MAQENRSENGADALVRRLHEHGVRHVFGYPGGQITPLYDALYRAPHGVPGVKHGHVSLSSPLAAASTHASIDASIGR